MAGLIQSKIQEKIGTISNNYSSIKNDYEQRFLESINQDPISSINNFHLKYCKYRVSIIISSWNSGKTLLLTLKTIEESYICQEHNEKLEVIIVDDGSTDSTEEEIKSNQFNFRYKYIKQIHLGRAQGINMGVLKSSGDILLICDADILLFPFTLDELIKRQQEYLDNAIFFGFREDVKIDNSKIGVENISDYVSRKEPCFWLDNRFKTDFKGSWGENMMLETNLFQDLAISNNLWVSDNKTSMYDCWQLYRMVYGFLFTVSRKNFMEVGGFCEFLVGWGYDDTSFTALCLEKNIKIIPVPSAHCLHIYHPIRMSSQWEDGSKNEKRMNNYISSEKRINYLKQDYTKRILLEYNISSPDIQKRVPTKYKMKDLTLIELARISYQVGHLKKSQLYYNKAKNDFSVQDYENYFDILIRLNDEETFGKFHIEEQKYKKYYYYNLAKYYFKDEINVKEFKQISMESKYIGYLLKIKNHKERAEQYFLQRQWYLSFRDYFAAYIMGEEGSKDACDFCIERIKEENLN